MQHYERSRRTSDSGSWVALLILAGIIALGIVISSAGSMAKKKDLPAALQDSSQINNVPTGDNEEVIPSSSD